MLISGPIPHALPTERLGEGIIDFADMHRRIQATGFRGHYMAAFGSLDDMLGGREILAAEMGKG